MIYVYKRYLMPLDGHDKMSNTHYKINHEQYNLLSIVKLFQGYKLLEYFLEKYRIKYITRFTAYNKRYNNLYN